MLKDKSKQELLELRAQLQKEYDAFKAKGLKLDMSRGKPGADQLNLSNGLFDAVTKADYDRNLFTHPIDYRNYGSLTGIEELRKIFSDMLEVPAENIIVCGNSSLNLMFDYITQCMLSGVDGSHPWCKEEKVKFLCPVPGYDRHFAITEYYGIEMLPVPMTGKGPDMDAVEALVKDPAVKGMFCVPKYSNPTGETYSAETVERIASLKPAAPDFRIIWDNAYIIHDLKNETDRLENIFSALERHGNEDMVVEFVSTSKISFPGSGVACIAASTNNIEAIKRRMQFQTIGHDKLNMLRHVIFFKSLDGMKAHMELHKAILAPKFKAVEDEFERSLGGLGIAEWTKPNGGYFISLDVMPGTAKEVGRLAKEAGVVLTTVGATYPYGKDPEDKNIRIAPSFPPVDELELATKLLCVCIKLAAVEKLLGE